MFNLLSFCSAWHGLYIYVYSFPVSWINFPKYWTECCSPSSFSVKTLWSPKTMLSIKFPEVWISMTANTFCLCVLWKACITWHFWTTNRKLTFSWKITLQGAIPPLNVYGFSPNQLVFGRNLNFPAVHFDRLPAQNASCASNLIMNNLVALHKARQAFIAQESCEKLRRALRKQTCTYSDTVYHNGDSVYYKREKSSAWHGPAKVLGKDGAQHLLKHGGVYVRVHPCKMQLVSPSSTEFEGDNSSSPNEPEENGKPESHTGCSDDEEDEDISARVITAPLSPPPTPVNADPHLTPQRADIPEAPDVHHVEERSESDQESEEFSSSSHETEQSHKVPRALRRLQDYNNPGIKERSVADSSHEEEIYFGRATDGTRFDEAKKQELQKWKDMDVYTEVDNDGQNYITTRWVCTEKLKGGKMVQKARLVARGFEEDASQLRKDSPTCSKESLRMLLCILAANNWELRSIDIKSAYLQGCPISRELYIFPPDGTHTGKLWKLNKTPYGLVDAGRKWYIRVMKEFTSLGARQAKCDQAVYIWPDPSGQGSCGILIAHVDDFLYGGNEHFLGSILPQIRKIFIIGLEERQNMKYLGLYVNQTESFISLSNDDYSESIQEIDTTTAGTDKSRLLTKEESDNMRTVIGQINWVTNQTRPDVSFNNCIIANSTKHSTVSDLHQVNKAVRKVRSHKVSLTFPSNLDLDSCHLVAFCDASFANLPDRGSQGGHIIFVTDQHGNYCVIAWQSKRIKRVVTSSLAAECLAAMETADTCILLPATLEEYLCREKDSIKITIICDNKSLVNAVHTSTSVENKRLQIDISALREMIHKREIFQFRWIDTSHQVANALTKAGALPDYLLRILRCSMHFSHESGIFY